MGRRRRTSVAEDLADLVAMLPGWAGLALAVVSYLLLHHAASQPFVTTPGQISATITQTFWRALANAGQYVVPAICLIGAALSAWRRREKEQLVQNVVHSKAADALDGMSWQQFERLVGEAFRLQGYSVTETGGGGADGGVDLVLSKHGEKHLVQCKQWRAFKVGVDIVRELYGVMAARGAAGGFVVTSGHFTDEAIAFAKGRNIKLVDGQQLHGLLRPVQAAARTTSPDPERAGGELPTSPGAPIATPPCPVCSKSMQLRTAKRGARAGGQFWGCSGYPVCRGVRDLST